MLLRAAIRFVCQSFFPEGKTLDCFMSNFFGDETVKAFCEVSSTPATPSSDGNDKAS